MVLVVVGTVKAGSVLYHNVWQLNGSAFVFSPVSLEHHILIQSLQVQLELPSYPFQISVANTA